MSNRENYESFIKPSFAPPEWVFGIVWTILYLLMAIAAYRIWLKGKKEANVRKALTLYGIQLLLNFLWTIIFFRFRLIGLAFFELMLLLIFTLLTTFEFFRIDKIAGILMIPYILWVSFAGVLNFTFWMLNNM
ncbi:tryptophan-rich sensory protein [Clostridium sp. YIM B02515]|uniref:Tryptophan-rich sensory protein n=2 Tax=Clostridium rhizosphaerae TaxID=2803861 RepID=A0ABS1T8W8_9CLOT|nr:tryptophan-rich sensory protein [Clostridium rhizosphaerae]